MVSDIGLILTVVEPVLEQSYLKRKPVNLESNVPRRSQRVGPVIITKISRQLTVRFL